jgi:biotin operon repressor
MTWVFKQPLKPSWLKFLLIALADCANDEGHCYPSGKYLCIKTGLNRKTVIAGLDTLEAKGYLIDTGQRKGVTKQVKIYQIRVPDEGLLNSTVNGTLIPERVPSADGKSPVRTTKESRARDTESSLNLKEPLKEDLSTRLKAMIASFEKIGNTAKAAKYRAELEMLSKDET